MAAAATWRGGYRFIALGSRPNAVCRTTAVCKRYQSTRGGNVIDTLEERGLFYQTTAPTSLRTHLGQESSRTVYAGVDPSAESLHVGNLLPLLAILHFMRHGHKAVVLIGGATGMIGDPSGRSSERQALSNDEVLHNVERITEQVVDFFGRVRQFVQANGMDGEEAFDVDKQLQIVNNAKWYENMNVLEFLRSVGKHARISNMLARDSVKSRLVDNTSEGEAAAGLSFTEFSYQLLQAYDFSVLHEQPWSCTVQLGGSDQMGNIAAGVDLIRRKKALHSPDKQRDEKQEPAYGLTLPLLTTSSGAKFGKSAGNAVWLDPRRCSNYDFYQYFLRSRDEDVELYLRTLTLMPLQDVQMVMKDHLSNPAARIAQLALAKQMTEMTRGVGALRQAEIITQVLHGHDVKDIDTQQIVAAFGDDHRLKRIPRSQAIGVPITKLAAKLKLAQSNNAARQIANNGGLYVNNIPLQDPSASLTDQDVVAGTNLVFLRIGSKEHAVVVLE